jgi:hypothetical protein
MCAFRGIMQYTMLLLTSWHVIIEYALGTVAPQSTLGYFYQEYYSGQGCVGNVTFAKGYLSTASNDPSPVCLPVSSTQSMSYFCDYAGTTVYQGPSTPMSLTVVQYSNGNCTGSAMLSATYPMGTCAAAGPSDTYFGASFRSLCNYIPSPPLREGRAALIES